VCILDGFGFNTEDKWNGIHMAETPVYDSLRKNEERFRCIRRNPLAAAFWHGMGSSRNTAHQHTAAPSRTHASKGVQHGSRSTQLSVSARERHPMHLNHLDLIVSAGTLIVAIKCPRTVRAHGTAVGLPSDADMGNSEVGHNALGSGQVVDQVRPAVGSGCVALDCSRDVRICEGAQPT
jgi:Metalloenzyme superfamily